MTRRRSNSSEDEKPMKKRKTTSEAWPAGTEDNGGSASSMSLRSSRRGLRDANVGTTEDLPPPLSETQNTRHPTLWFTDGLLTVVSSDGMAFKLHSGVVAHHSEVLKNSIATLGRVPHAGGEPSLNEEVTLHLPEKGAWLSELFSTMYNGSSQCAYFNHTTSIPFEQFYWILHLGVKYKVQHVVTSGFTRLKRIFPPALDDWLYSDHVFGGDSIPMTMEDEHVIAIIVLTRAAKQTDFLPVALYVCSTFIDTKTILSGIMLGTEVIKLDIEDQIACIDARQRIQAIEDLLEQAVVRRAIERLSNDSCCKMRHKDNCRAAFKFMITDSVESGTFRDGKPFDPWVPWINDAKPKLCSSCREPLQLEMTKHVQAGWESLGDIFKIPEWSPPTTQATEANEQS